jgi:uncharacterized membrane protein YukC
MASDDKRLDNFWFMMQALAAGRVVEHSEEYTFRAITREYAMKFNERLSDVRRMDFKGVLLEVLEARLDKLPRADLMEFVRDLLSDDDAERKAAEERMRRYEEQEKERLAKQTSRKAKRKKQKIVTLASPPADPVPVVTRRYDMGDPDKE